MGTDYYRGNRFRKEHAGTAWDERLRDRCCCEDRVNVTYNEIL